MEIEKTYADGVVQGRLDAIENIQTGQNIRLDNHATRLSSLEKAMWVVIGAIAALEFFPVLADFLRKIGDLPN